MRGTSAFLLATLPATAAAHVGLQPQTIDVLEAPRDATPAVEATFGLLLQDEGGAFRFTCHEALIESTSTTAVPSYVRVGDGVMLATIGALALGRDPAETLYRSVDGGCDWAAVAGLTGLVVTALALDPADRQHILVTTGTLGEDVADGIYASTDGGANFAATGWQSEGRVHRSVRFGPSGSGRAYATVATYQPDSASLLVSDDFGGTFVERPILEEVEGAIRPNADVLAVDPGDADVLWVRVAADQFDHLLRSDDSGTTWTDVLQDSAGIPDAAWGPDGALYVVARDQGLLRSEDGVLFTPVAGLPVIEGVAAADDALWLAVSELIEDHALARFEDGASAPTFGFDELAGPLECPAGTLSATYCTPLWPTVAQVLQLGGDDDDDSTPPGDDDDDCTCASSPLRPPIGALAVLLTLVLRRR